MYGYAMLQEQSHERRERLMREAAAERLAREARGMRHRQGQRFALGAAFGLFHGARRQAARQRAGA